MAILRERNYALDLYRLLCMFLITTIHILGYSNLIDYIPWTHINFYIVEIIKVLQFFSINGFIMISSYFLIERDSTARKIISFEMQLLFYSIAVFFVSLFITTDGFSVNLFKSFFPLLTNHYWYPVNYIILLISSPWINKIVKKLNKKELLTIILFLSFVVSVFYHLNPFFDSMIFVGYRSRSIIWFFLLYLISGYIKLYGVKSPKKTGYSLFFISAISFFIPLLINDGAFSLADKLPVLINFFEASEILSYSSLPGLLLTVSSFIIFTNIKIDNKALAKVFKIVTPSLFGVYLIQEHRAIRSILWDFVSVKEWAQSYYLVLIIVLIFVVLLCCSIILYIIYTFLHKLFLNKLENAIYNFYLKKKDRISEFYTKI